MTYEKRFTEAIAFLAGATGKYPTVSEVLAFLAQKEDYNRNQPS